MPECTQCNHSFTSSRALFAHCRDKGDHHFCSSCERLFSSLHGLHQHLNDSTMHRSDSEGDTSESSSDDDDDDKDDEEPFCAGCNRWFSDLQSLYKHRAASSNHNWCFMCSRDFLTPTSLEQHSSSHVHRVRDCECPLCPKRFKASSSIALHIESGACHSFLPEHVTAVAHALEVVPTISISRHIEGGTPRVVTYYATECAFNGIAYECYLCHRTFGTLKALNSHVGSPAHNANEFKCPKCKREYKLISGLIQHIESEVCGIAKFETVLNFTRNLTDPFRQRLAWYDGTEF